MRGCLYGREGVASVYRKYSICESSKRQRGPEGEKSVCTHARRTLPLLRLLLLRSIALILRRRIKDIEMLLAIRPNLEDTRHVAASIAVVRRRPDGRELVVVQDRKAFHAELVRAEDVHHVVAVEELLNDL